MSAYDSACHPLNIFVHKDGQQFGPFTFGEIRHELNIGTFSPADLAWHEGFSDWVTLRSIVNSTETTEARSFAAPAAVLTPKKKQRIHSLSSVVRSLLFLLACFSPSDY